MKASRRLSSEESPDWPKAHALAAMSLEAGSMRWFDAPHTLLKAWDQEAQDTVAHSRTIQMATWA